MRIQKNLLLHRFPDQTKLISNLFSFFHQNDLKFHFSEDELTEFCNWMVNYDEEGAQAFWEVLARVFEDGDSALNDFLRKILKPQDKVDTPIFSPLSKSKIANAVRRFSSFF